MRIRRARGEDLPRILEIYARARAFMAAHGNPLQWGPTSWPPEELVREDLRTGRGYVCEDDGRVAAAFFFDQGPDIEPTYRAIEQGSWLDGSPYGVVHRIATSASRRGVGAFCLEWAFAQCGHMRIDTHPDNVPMQNLLSKLGFERRGIIHVQEDPYPRFAYEKTRGA